MSYYDSGNVTVTPDLELMGSIISTGSAAVAGAGIAVAAGTLFAGGWLLYTSGKLMFDEAQRARRETEERKEKERIRNEQRKKLAEKERQRKAERRERELLIKQQMEKKREEGKLSMKESLTGLQMSALETGSYEGDIKGFTVEEERYTRLLSRMEEVFTELLYGMDREKARESLVPYEKEDKNQLIQIFSGVTEKMEKMESGVLLADELEYELRELKKKAELYKIKAVELDEKEEWFLCTYQAYEAVCRKLGDSCQPIGAFSDIRELERAMDEKEERVLRMEECARLFAKHGKNAYISMALDEEMKKLGYHVTEREMARQYLHTDCSYNEEEGILYFQMGDGSLTQIYKVTEKVFVQVIVRTDGTTSMETFTVDDRWDKEDVIADQKTHCGRNEILAENLKKNWFVVSEIKEQIPPEYVVLRKAAAKLFTGGIGRASGVKTGHTGHQTIK